jgi:MarR family transcriptional regulator, organic hydroperoxide resistance regulator
MSKAKSRVHQGRQKDASAEEAFPPLTTSLECFVKGGSDREFRQLIYDLTSLFNLMLRGRKQFAAYIGVTEAKMLMMTIIAESQGATVGYIAQQLNVSSQFVTIEINDLVKRDIVEKRPNEADRRSMFLDLTSKGRDLLRELAPLRRKANDMTFRSLTGDRARVLKEIISTLIADGNIAVHELEAPHLRGKMAPSAEPETKVEAGARRSTGRMHG